ncbi:MAG: PAS domain S-box protein, partial [Chloroflexi bacterium]|nr:PAS domain S-box protein [Chloroflexota bacterium]
MNETDKRLYDWRAKALDVFLTAAALISFPVALIPVAGAVLNPEEWPGAIAISALFLMLLGLAMLRKINPAIRGWTLISLGYLAAILDVTRTNLAGDAAIYLLAMPLLAFILLRPRAGYIAGGISLVLYWLAAILTDSGMFDAMIINRENPFTMRWWVDAGTTFVLLLITLLILFHQFFILLQKTIEAESAAAKSLSESNEQLEQANRQLTQANDQLEDKVEQRTEKLRESERKLMDIIDFLPDATVVIDEGGRVVAWNRVMDDITGVKAEDMLGKGKYEYATPFYGERRPTLIDLVQTPNEEFEKRYTFIKREGSTITGEAYVPNLKGRPAYLYSTASALKDPKGNYAGAIETVRDITDRKRAEEELRMARDAANAASEAKSTFLASMSHEIRTPLNGIVGMTGLLFDTPLTPEQREFAETIRSSGDALLAIINDILDFSKIEAGKMEMEHQPFDLRECVESAVDLLAYRASEKGIEMGVLMDHSLPTAVIGDVTRLRQVIVNLLGNAVKFTERGEIIVEATSFRVASEAQVPIVHFVVRDTGIGIPANRLDSIFQSFSQVDASTTRKYGGSGLGLAISKRLVELMGGKMWVESVEGKGSAFHFTVQAPPTMLTKHAAGTGAPELTGRRLLIVDDNETNRRILSLQAQSWGMIPTAYSSPLSALNVMKSGECFDLAILDMHMPEMDGVVLSEEIRK